MGSATRIQEGFPKVMVVLIMQDFSCQNDMTVLLHRGICTTPHNPLHTQRPLLKTAENVVTSKHNRNGPKQRGGGKRGMRKHGRPTQKGGNRASMKRVLSNMAGVVLEYLVKPGEQIAVDQDVVMLESMKMQIPVQSTVNGTVKRSEEHTSELQSPDHLVCRLLLEKKNELLQQTATAAVTVTPISHPHH